MYREEAIVQINQQLDEIFSEKLRVAVWGITDYTRALFEETNLFDYKIDAVVDADEKKRGQRFFCMNIKNPNDIDFCRIDLVIVGAVGYKRDIQTYLAENNFGNTKVVELEPTVFHKMYRNYDDKKIHYVGNYQSWEEAESLCTGYDDEEILNKVKEATMSVINGNAIYERDSVLFYSKKYAYPILATLLKTALLHNKRSLKVLDLGGSLGSTFLQNREYFDGILNIEWIIAEQRHFVDFANKNIHVNNLRFISSEEELPNVDVVLISACIQYINEYPKFIEKVIQTKASTIILDRVIVGNRKRITLQEVPKKIYNAKYPLYVFSEQDVMGWFEEYYRLEENDIADVSSRVYFEDDSAIERFYVFRR